MNHGWSYREEDKHKVLQAFFNWWIMVGVIEKKINTRCCRHSLTDESWSELCRRKWAQGTAGIPLLMNLGRSCAEENEHKALQAFLHWWIVVGVVQKMIIIRHCRHSFTAELWSEFCSGGARSCQKLFFVISPLVPPQTGKHVSVQMHTRP